VQVVYVLPARIAAKMTQEERSIFTNAMPEVQQFFLKGSGDIDSISGTGKAAARLFRIEVNRAAQKPCRNRSEGDVKATVRVFFTWLRSSGEDPALDNLIDAMDNEDDGDEVVYGHDGIPRAPLRVDSVDRIRGLVQFKPSIPDGGKKSTILFSTLGQYLSEIHHE